MVKTNRPTIGLALGGSGSRTCFYIGFLEVFDEEKVPIDFLTASSGASIVASAYACGTLQNFKELAISLDNDSIKKFIGSGGRGGLYSLDGVEERMREFTKGKTFEEVSPHMSFTTVDIENGEQINLCMGDIAKACRISCTLPGVFTPVKWGSRTLVDGGLLNLVPINALKEFPVDITIGVDIPGTKFIFTWDQMTIRKTFNMLKKILLIDEVANLLSRVFSEKTLDFEESPGFFSVLGRSMDLAIEATKEEAKQDMNCDLLITPKIPLLKPKMLVEFNPYYEMGRQSAKEFMPKIKELIKQKEESKAGVLA